MALQLVIDYSVLQHGFCGLFFLCQWLTCMPLAVDACKVLLCVLNGNSVTHFGHTVSKCVPISGGSGQSMPEVIHLAVLLVLQQLNDLIVFSCCGHELTVLLIVLIA